MLNWLAETCNLCSPFSSKASRSSSSSAHESDGKRSNSCNEDTQPAPRRNASVSVEPCIMTTHLPTSQHLTVPKRANQLAEALDSGAGSELQDNFEQLKGIVEDAAGVDSGHSGSEGDDSSSTEGAEGQDRPSKRRLSSVQRVAARWRIRPADAAEIMLRFEVAQVMVASDFEPSSILARSKRRHSMHTITLGGARLGGAGSPKNANPAPGPASRAATGSGSHHANRQAARALRAMTKVARSRTTMDFTTSSPGFLHLVLPATPEVSETAPLPVALSSSSSRQEPISFAQAAKKGFQSSSFDLSENLSSGDARGLAVAELEDLMKDGTRTFDEARVELVRRQMIRHGINPETGLLME